MTEKQEDEFCAHLTTRYKFFKCCYVLDIPGWENGFGVLEYRYALWLTNNKRFCVLSHNQVHRILRTLEPNG